MKLYGSAERQAAFDRLAATDFYRRDPLQVQVVADGVIVPSGSGDTRTGLDKPTFGPGGVCDSQGHFSEYSFLYAEHLIHLSGICRNRFGGACDYDHDGVRSVDAEVIYDGFFWKQWGHFLIDMIGRLWYALEHDLKIAFVTRGDMRIDGPYLELLTLLGITEDRIIYIGTPTRFRAVHVPETSFYPGRYYTDTYRQMMQRITVQAEAGSGDSATYPQIYFSRRHASGGEIGEETIERLMRDNGFQVLYPEEMSVAAQVRAVHRCEVLAGIAGSAMHNAVFSAPGTKQYFFHRHRIFNPYQIQISRMNEVEMVAVDSYTEPLPPLGLKTQFWVGPHWTVANRYVRESLTDAGYQYHGENPVKTVGNGALYLAKYGKNAVRLKKG